MGKYIPVEPEKWAEMVKAMAEVTRLKAEVDELKRMLEASTFGIEFAKEDIKKLEAEVERLRLQVGTDAIDREHGMCCDSSAENARLKSEVERLQNNCDYLDRELDREIDKTAMLCGQVERLEQQVKYWRIEAETDHARWLRVLEDVERLRKAGDVMAEALSLNDDVFDNQEKKEAQAAWNAAKEGKQP